MESKKAAAVIFDCDGVMFDSRGANIHFYNYILQHFHLPPMTEDKIDFVHSHTAEDSVRHIFKDTQYLKKAQEFRKKMDYAPFIFDMIIEPGLKELLQELKERFSLAVATNRSNTIGKVLEHHGLDRFFDIVVSSLDVENPKPHPESLLKILEFFHIKPRKSIYIGDSLVDYQTARAAGVRFIAYKNRVLKADYHADSMSEISKLFRSGDHDGIV